MSEKAESAQVTENYDQRKPGRFLLGFLVFGGVLVPIAALFVELIWKTCAENLFDPIPTWWHVLIVAFVPATNFQIYRAFQKGYTLRPWWISFANGVSIFISLFYAVAFAPIVPIAVIAILAALLGLLPLAPFFSLIAGAVIRPKLRSLFSETRSGWLQWKALGAAFLFVFATMGLAELNFTVTRLGVLKASSTNVKTQEEGVELLRKYGDIDYLLRLSYDGSAVVSSNLFLNILSSGDTSVDTNGPMSTNAQKAYYRLTGKHFRQVEVPRGVRHWDRIENWDDLDQNGSVRVRNGLRLAVSQIDGSVDSDAALGYLEWTLVFKNESPVMQEAIAQIQLPPDGSVSRLTLWINGEEREAAFGKTSKVTEAYNAVTTQRRDPALVTMTGKDRIQLKCFPVPARGELKVRIGITSPAVLEDAESALIAMPYFQERNFVVSTEHSIWVESKNDLEIANAAFRRERGVEFFGVRGRLSDDDLNKLASPIRLSRSGDGRSAWAKDSLNKGFVVTQELREINKPPVRGVIFVIDPSVQLAGAQNEIVAALRQLPGEIPASLVFSGGNGLNSEIAAPNFFEGSSAEVADKVAQGIFAGGVDGIPAIERAWEIAQSKPGSAIVWIHGPQVVELESPARLSQLWTRRPTEVPVFSLQIGNGPNPIERVLNESDAVSTIPRLGSTADDLATLFRKLVNGHSSFTAVRTVEKRSDNQGNAGKETSQHLVRLWAYDESLRLLKAGDDAEAVELAVKNQLVTRVSGAVVLETQEQYDQFGLKPVEANSVPTIPEPHEYFLFGICMLVLLYFGRRMRRSRMEPA
jgi:hypothetical protein